MSKLFYKNGVIKDNATILAENLMYNTLLDLMKDFKKRRIPLVEVRAAIQCLMGSMNEGIVIFLRQK